MPGSCAESRCRGPTAPLVTTAAAKPRVNITSFLREPGGFLRLFFLDTADRSLSSAPGISSAVIMAPAVRPSWRRYAKAKACRLRALIASGAWRNPMPIHRDASRGHLRENLAAAHVDLDDEVLARLESIAGPTQVDPAPL